MNAIVNKFLLAGGTFMPKMRLRQPELTYSACAPFITIKKKKIKRNRRFKIDLSKRIR